MYIILVEERYSLGMDTVAVLYGNTVPCVKRRMVDSSMVELDNRVTLDIDTTIRDYKLSIENAGK